MASSEARIKEDRKILSTEKKRSFIPGQIKVPNEEPNLIEEFCFRFIFINRV